MARTENSIIIERPREFVFDVTNDLPRWTELFTEYKEVKILEHKDNKFTFQLTTHGDEEHKSMSWRSNRTIDKANWKIKAQREEPMFPWTHMNIEWHYDEVPEGTKLTFIQDFGVDPKTGKSDDDGVVFINKNSKIEMQHIKEALESGKFDK